MGRRSELISVERQGEHPLVGFVLDETLTSGRLNGLLVLLGPLLAVGGAIEEVWVWSGVGVLFVVVAARNYRVYRRRLRRALASAVSGSNGE